LPERNARQGFFEADEFHALSRVLPDDLQDFVRFGYLTGWRKGEIQTLTWDCIDRAAGVIRLRAQHSKNDKGRAIGMDSELLALIQRREHARLVESATGDIRVTDAVFHRVGKRVGTFRKAWATACLAAGLFHVEKTAQGTERKVPDKLFHDLRRTAVRNMVRSGVPERTTMEVSGHKTRAIFDRYDIVNEQDTRNALALTRSYVAARLSAHAGSAPA
jgi:integrase